MDRTVEAVNIEEEIEEVIKREGVDRAEAIVIVALRHGEVYGEGDLVSIRPLSGDERRKAGLDRTLDEVMAAQRARQSGAAARSAAGAPGDSADDDRAGE